MEDDKIISSILKQAEKIDYPRNLGIRLIKLEPGHAITEMTPREDTKNIYDTTHGGAIFSLMDEALMASSNSRGKVAVALNMTLTYHQAPEKDSILRAESKEVHLSNRTATYRIEVTDEKNTLIASCLALAYRKEDKLPFLEEE
jgi:acyl-CoA thioesterase